MTHDRVDSVPHPSSLGWKIFSVGATSGLVLLGALIVLGVLSVQARTELSQATHEFIEEQQIANRITQAVMQQLATASTLPAEGADQITRSFQEAGDAVYTEIRRYLFRDLTPGQRVQLEETSEAHQRLEVAAARTADLATRGALQEAEEAREVMFSEVFTFLDEVAAFLRMREEALQALNERQDAVFRLVYLGGGAVALLLFGTTLLLLWLLHRRVVRPLDELALSIERLGSGDLAARVPDGPDRETRLLSDGFNRMAENLREAQSELERRNAELASALKTVRETQSELIQAEKLSAMGRMTAGLAHELNNPLASVLGYAQLLAGKLEAAADEGAAIDAGELQADYMRPILHEAERARELVRGFLQLSRRSDAELRPVALRPALELVIGLRGYAFQQEGMELRVDAIPDCHVRAEPQMLQGMFLNIVNNALDAMRSQGHGRLLVEGEVSGDRVEIRFRDEGPGFADPDRAFEPFYTTKPVGEGTGLGLALVHRFVELFGGRIHVENPPAGGALLTISLLVVPAPALDAPRREPAGEAPPPPSAAPTGESAPPRILVIDDEAPVRKLQERILERLNAVVFQADGATAAREVLAAEPVDLVLCDVKMPGESGLELHRWIRANRPDLMSKFLFVTGDVSEPELVELQGKDPDLFIHKPFRLDSYLSRVRSRLE